MNCPNCNKPISGAFCTNCGFKNPFRAMDHLGGNDGNRPAPPPPTANPGCWGSPPVRQGAPAVQPPLENRDASEKSGAMKWILIGIASVLAVGVLVLLIVLLGDGVKKQDTDGIIPGETKVQQQQQNSQQQQSQQQQKPQQQQQSTVETPKKEKPYLGKWITDYYYSDGGWLEITESSVTIDWEGDGGGTYPYTELGETQYTTIKFTDAYGDNYITYINPDLLVIYDEDDYADGYYFDPDGEIDEAVFLVREGAETTNITLPDSYYLYFNDVEQEYVYYPNANLLAVHDVGDPEGGYLLLYIDKYGSLEPVSCIATYDAKDIPDGAIYTDANYIIVPDRLMYDDVDKDFIGKWRIYCDSNRNKTTDEMEAEFVWDIYLTEDGSAIAAAGYYCGEYSYWYEGTWTQDASDPYILTLNIAGGKMWFDETGTYYNSYDTYNIKVKVTIGGAESNRLAFHSLDDVEDITLRLNEWYERQ